MEGASQTRIWTSGHETATRVRKPDKEGPWPLTMDYIPGKRAPHTNGIGKRLSVPVGIDDELSDGADASQYPSTTRQLQRGYLGEGPL